MLLGRFCTVAFFATQERTRLSNTYRVSSALQITAFLLLTIGFHTAHARDNLLTFLFHAGYAFTVGDHREHRRPGLRAWAGDGVRFLGTSNSLHLAQALH